MKPGIHSDYGPVVFRDASAGKEFRTRSTVTSAGTTVWSDGKFHRRTRSSRAQWLRSATAPTLVEVTTLDGRRITVPAAVAKAARRGLI
jgi:ribosomal protein L31